MALTLTAAHLRRLCLINSFPAPSDSMILFGLRGCLPVNPANHNFAASHNIEIRDVDYTHPRCTIGQWLPQEGRLALFPASTVPHIRFIRNVPPGQVNQLMPGYFDDYRRAVHQPVNRDFHHDAFKMDGGRPVQRTFDDPDYEADDPIIPDHKHDNIHCGECVGINADRYNSAGCQVVVGRARYLHRPNSTTAQDPWKTFIERAYNRDQVKFHYFLLTAGDARRVIDSGGATIAARIRFGSRGELVTTVQRALEVQGFYAQRIDDHFGRWTLDAVLRFQREAFPGEDADGVVGPVTAAALGFTEWPRL